MAPSRPPPVDQPPSASSSEEEESDDETMLNQKPAKDISEDEEEGEEEEEEEEETDDDEEIPQSVVNKHNDKKPIPTQSSLPLESEDDEDEEEEGTESDDFDMQAVPSPSISNFTIKPNTTASNKQPVDHSSPMSKKSSGKADPPLTPTTSTATTTTQARSSTKRALEISTENGKGSPKKRRGITSNGAEEKSGTNRLWSENDQIAILKGMIDYQSNNGADPLTDTTAFHDMMKKSLHVDVSKGQMMDKIRRMRKKYLNNAEKGENGKDPVFAKPYESQSFELSKRIWGVNNVSNGISSSRKRKVKKVEAENPQTSSQENGIMDIEMKEEEVTKEKEVKEEEEESDEDFWKKYPLLEISLKNWMESPVVGGEVGKKALRSIGNSNAKELEEKWRKFRVEELELHIKKMDLIYQQTKMIQQTFNQTNG